MASTWRLIENGPCYPSKSAARAKTRQDGEPTVCKGCPACGVTFRTVYAAKPRVCRKCGYARMPGDMCASADCPSNEQKARPKLRYSKGGGSVDGKPLGGGRVITVATRHGYHDYLAG